MNWQNYYAVKLFPGFDTFPVIHTTLSFLISGLLLVWLLFFSHRWRGWFVPATLAVLFFLRLPSIVYNREINPDESQMITQALTLGQYDPVYFRSVDGTTGGPLNSYFLVLPSFVGLPYDYITTRLVAYGLLIVSLWLLYKTARHWFGEQPARQTLLPVVFTVGLTQNADFLHYSSELIPLVLLGITYFLYARQTTRLTPPRTGVLFLMGLMLGMVPFAKLQGVPLAAAAGLFIVLDVLSRTTQPVSKRAIQLTALVAGGLAFPALFVGFTAAVGEFQAFITFYIQGNLNYGSETSQIQNILNLPNFFRKSTEFFWLLLLTLGVGLVALIAETRSHMQPRPPFTPADKPLPDQSSTPDFTRWSARPLLFLMTLTLATVLAITRTGTEYVHQLYFLMGPLFLWLAYGFQVWLRHANRQPVWLSSGFTIVLLLATGFVKVAGFQNKEQPINPYPSDHQGGWRIPPSPLVHEIRKYAQPGEPLVIWGWRCDYYVEAQMPQGVAENHSIRSAFVHPLQANYQQRYIQNFYRSFPPVFIDAVGSQNMWMTDRKTHGHEMIKPLGAFVKAHYKYMGLANDARIYVRFDRINGKPANASPIALTQQKKAAINP